MQFANYFFASIISFLGLAIGFMLIKIAPEEQQQLMKYFSFAKKFLLLLISIFLIFHYSYNSLYILGLIACCMLLLYIDKKIKDITKKSMLIYLILGFLFFLSSKDTSLFVLVSSLILLYGMFNSSMLEMKPGVYGKFLANNAIFILTANIPLFL